MRCVCIKGFDVPFWGTGNQNGRYTFREGDEFLIIENAHETVLIEGQNRIRALIDRLAFEQHFERKDDEE